MKLGERLAALASFVPKGARVADIGTDHGYLPINLIQNNRAISAVAGDVHKGPYEAAKENVKNMGLATKISVRFGNGLAVLAPGEVDTVVIAGMGGSTIIEILKSEPIITGGLTRLILQPMIAAGTLRSWLIHNQWYIVDEALVEDEGRLYEVIVAEQGTSPEYEPIMYDVGMILWTKKPALLDLHLEHLIGQTKRVLQEMNNSDHAKQSSKFAEYEHRLKQLEAKRGCL